MDSTLPASVQVVGVHGGPPGHAGPNASFPSQTAAGSVIDDTKNAGVVPIAVGRPILRDRRLPVREQHADSVGA